MNTRSGDPPISDRQRKVLKHLARYRLSFRPLLTRQFFDGSSKACRNTLEQLTEKGLIQSLRRSLGRFTTYQISESGARVIGCSPSRSKLLGPEALPKHLAVLWFCYYGKKRRTRLEVTELAHPSLFGFKIDGIHCFEPEGVRFEDNEVFPCVYQVFHLAAGAREDRLLARASTLPLFVRDKPDLKPFVDLKLYRIAVLGNTKSGLKDFVGKLAKTGVQEIAPIESQVVPTPHTFESTLKGVLKHEGPKKIRRVH